jgi:hypothetical protein
MAAIGFRVKSGFAIAIVLDGSARSPIAVARRIVELCDPNVAETRQPYHAGMGRAEENPRTIARRVKIIERVAARSVAAILDDTSGSTLPSGRLRAGLVVGSVIDPATVANPHIRAHANEGRVFRVVLERALAARGVTCSVIVEKQLSETARKALTRTDGEIARTVAALGRTLGSPWRSEEKAAATAALMSL